MESYLEEEIESAFNEMERDSVKELDELNVCVQALEDLLLYRESIANSSSPQETELIRARFKHLAKYELDQEAKDGSGFKLIIGLTKAIGKVLLKLAVRFGRFLKKYLSGVRRYRDKAEKLLMETIGNLHRYEETTPKIRMGRSKYPLWNGKAFYRPTELSALIGNDLSYIAPAKLKGAIVNELNNYPNKLVGAKTRKEINLLKESINERCIDVLRKDYGANLIIKNDKFKTSITVGHTPMEIFIKGIIGSGKPPQAALKYTGKMPKGIYPGYGPQEANVALQQVVLSLGRILDSEEVYNLEDEMKALAKNIERKGMTDQQVEALKVIPKWSVFLRNYASEAIKYEFRVCAGVVHAVRESKKQWKTKSM